VRPVAPVTAIVLGEAFPSAMLLLETDVDKEDNSGAMEKHCDRVGVKRRKRIDSSLIMYRFRSCKCGSKCSLLCKASFLYFVHVRDFLRCRGVVNELVNE